MATRLSPRNSEVSALEERGYLIGKKIGQGSYATVHLAEYLDNNSSKKMRLACKIFDKEKAPPDFLEKFFPRELEILTKGNELAQVPNDSIMKTAMKLFKEPETLPKNNTSMSVDPKKNFFNPLKNTTNKL
ncbi:Similar to TSSK1B: Testis-specific serine/threonine-protein kinase 1 (Homo sapiens) [Cotesia congregata]|uniref:Similar to TSSK1B: Testis-specific serine/threonine-protein kinase 1 (Homo sapiens) n=1 Tax=Cotesia congregata TaxID=51543 RepID=A0A8J2HNA2_COTCN|nr:Similar to TSSK1B: Testis-specific serine/threonine-protein kinase 1 (Homo sapiens) [Cotesia congregata]